MPHLVTFLILLFFSSVAWPELDLFVPALVDMMHDLNVDETTIQLTLSLNFLGLFLASILCGPLADSFGRKKIFIATGLLYLVSSLMCYQAPSIEWMLFGRFLQGVGVSGYIIVVTLVLLDIYTPEDQLKAQSISNAFVSIVMGAAPILGSFLTQEFGWRANFSVIFWGSVLATISSFFLNETIKEKKSFQVKSVFNDYFKVIKNKKFMAGFFGLTLAITPYWIFIAFFPLLFQQNLGVSLESYGYYQGALISAFGLTSFIHPKLSEKIDAGKLCNFGVYGFLIVVVLMLIAGFFMKDSALLITILSALGCVFMVFVNNYLFLQSINTCPDEIGAAASFFNIGRMLFLGISNAVMSLIYQGTFCSIAVACAVFIFAASPFCIWFVKNLNTKENCDDKELSKAA